MCKWIGTLTLVSFVLRVDGPSDRIGYHQRSAVQLWSASVAEKNQDQQAKGMHNLRRTLDVTDMVREPGVAAMLMNRFSRNDAPKMCQACDHASPLIGLSEEVMLCL